jgi:DNA-directed RNA polymerase specialized sigma24 family protein
MDAPPDVASRAAGGSAPGVAAPIDPRDVLESDPAVAKKLVAYAIKKTREIAHARDAAQEAVARMLQGRGFHGWDPAGKSLLHHLVDVVDTLVAASERRRAATKLETPIAGDAGDDYNPDSDRHPDSRPHVEQPVASVEETQRELRLAAEVVMRVDKDPVILRMLELEQEGIHDTAEQARRLGCTVNDLHRGRDRLARHRDAVLAREKRSGPS